MAQVPPSQHAVAVRRQLIDLVRSHGPELLDDSRRVRAMLADAVAGATAEANLIALALASGVAARLRESQHDPRAIPGVVDGLAQDLHRTSSVQPGDALWAVESVAAALGMDSGNAAQNAAPATGAPPVPPTGGGPSPHDLVVKVGTTQQVIAPGRVVTIGRDPSCTVTLDSPAVSRVHARVEHGPSGWEFRDEGSTQGSFVNGVAVTTTPVRDDTTVTLGQGEHAVVVRLGSFGEAPTRAPQRPLPAQATVLPGQRPGGPLGPGAAATELGGAAPGGPPLTVTLAGTTRTVHPGTALRIGREDDNDLVAAHSTVSRNHARIEHADGAWRLRDASSTSGTWLDGRRLSAPAILVGRQEFLLGDATTGDRLRTETAGSPPPPAPGGPRPTHATGQSRSRLVAAGVAGLALVLVAGGLGAWLLLDDDEPKKPVSQKADTVEISRDDIARATVHLSTPDGAGSGVVIDREKGLILTNAHVAASSAPGLGIYLRQFADEQDANPERVRVDVSDGLDESAEPRFYAELVAADGYLDVAVLRITTKLSGAPADEDDLADLVEVPLGDSDQLDTADDVAFYGYPAAAGSTAPTYTTGVVSGPVQDRRLDEFRAVINTTADISPGNSGGPAVDETGHVVGVATWRTFNDLGETAFSRIRPINLAKPVIEAAVGGTSYRSPWAERAPRTADVTFWDYGAPGGTAGRVSAGCTRTGPGSNPTTLLLDYKGFPGGRHTDVFAALHVQVGGEWTRVATSVTAFPTKLPSKGCLTLAFSDDVPPGTYLLKVGVGGDLRIVVDDRDFTIE